MDFDAASKLEKGTRIWALVKIKDYEAGTEMEVKNTAKLSPKDKEPTIIITAAPPVANAKACASPYTDWSLTAPGEAAGGEADENEGTPVYEAFEAMPPSDLRDAFRNAYIEQFTGFDTEALEHAATAIGVDLANITTDDEVGLLYSAALEECEALGKSPLLDKWQKTYLAKVEKEEKEEAAKQKAAASKPAAKAPAAAAAKPAKPRATKEAASASVTPGMALRVAGAILDLMGDNPDAIESTVSDAMDIIGKALS